MPSSVASHAPPPFYACYLLRSVAAPNSSRTYIGSSPDPARRKRQHNGQLTAGAHKTRNGRPWETQLVVWGFGSKIAALQFEWAWQKPHLSRHLRTKPSSSSGGGAVDVPQPLFPLSSRTTTAPMANGKRHLGAGSPQAQLLVLRALLRSEPFAAWGLRLTFFEEWAWAAWARLPPAPAPPLSRGERALPPAHLVACTADFRGVDGARTPLSALDAEAKKRLKLEPPAPAKGKGKSKEDDGTATLPGHWPEALPRSATAKAMGLTWAALEAAPCAAPPPPLLPEAHDEQGDSLMSSPTKGKGAAAAAHAPHERPRFRCDDNDLARLAYARLQHVLRQRHIAHTRFLAGSAVPPPAAESGPRVPCSACGAPVLLWAHASYALCPAPFTELAPRAPAQRSLFGLLPQASDAGASRHCDAVFHLECLADRFLAPSAASGSGRSDASASRTFLLPTHGACPSCSERGLPSGDGLWSDVVRATFRRRDVAEAELAARAKQALKDAKVAAKAPTRRRRAEKAAAAAADEAMQESSSEDSDEGLLARLDRLSKAKGKGRPAPKAAAAASGSTLSAVAAQPFAPTAPRRSRSPMARGTPHADLDAGPAAAPLPRPRARPAARSASASVLPLPPPRSSTPPPPPRAPAAHASDSPGLLASLDALMNDVPARPAAAKRREAEVGASALRVPAAPSSRPFARAKSASSAAPSLPEIIDLT